MDKTTKVDFTQYELQVLQTVGDQFLQEIKTSSEKIQAKASMTVTVLEGIMDKLKAIPMTSHATAG